MINVIELLPDFGSPEFKKRLEDELESRAADLPLEDCMVNGGWPDDSSVVVNIQEMSAEAETIEVRATVHFDETTRSGCADIENTDSHVGELEISIDRESGNCEISSRHSRCTTFDDDDDDVDFGEDLPSYPPSIHDQDNPEF